MRSLFERYPMSTDREEALTLELLAAIDAKSDVTQRHLADRLGVALGLANSYLRRCVRKGLVKITQAPANRYLYYLTPQGFTEKSRLTAQYLSASFDFYRRAGESVRQALNESETKGVKSILFVGISELAEITSARCHDVAIEIVGTYAPLSTRASYLGKPVWSTLASARPFDVAMLTALDDCVSLYQELAAELGTVRLVIPDLLQPLIDAKLRESV